MPDNQDMELPYISSSPSFIDMGEPEVVNAQDEVDFPTLLKVSKLIANRKAYYNSVDSLSAKELSAEKLDVETQLIINKKMIFHLSELQGLIDQAVTKVRETNSGQR